MLEIIMTFVDRIKFCKVHPAIGIARVGNSPNEYFVGPEIPGRVSPPQGGYKDGGDCDALIPPRIKRQAARFHIFGYDEEGKAIKELTSDDADITWTVHLMNKKAAWHKFDGRAGEAVRPPGKGKPAGSFRNKDVRQDRDALVIDPGTRSLNGPNQSDELVGGTFMGIDVPLGNIQTDEKARLLVLGGFGKSGTQDPSKRIGHYANNDRWYDDVSDGFVVAEVKLKGERETLPTAPSWAIVTPPDFAPPITHFVTLYDVVFDVAVRNGWIIIGEEPSFTNHIYPILSRITALQWVNLRALTGHGSPAPGGLDFSNEETLQTLSTIADGDRYRPARERVFNFIRDPDLVERFRHQTASKIEIENAQAQAQARFMPPLAGDDGDPINDVPGTWFTITKTQYEMLRKWKDGYFKTDWTRKKLAALTIMHTPGAFAAGEHAATENLIIQADLSDNITPEGLDRAALESCAGGAFFPGIEAGWIMRDPSIFVGTDDPFRLNHKNLAPGDITKRMACPWQADFYECNTHWWPAQRPDDVLTLETYFQAKQLDDEIISKRNEIENESLPVISRLRLQNEIAELSTQRDGLWRKRDSWDRGLREETVSTGVVTRAYSGLKETEFIGDERMVRDWHHLGFLVNASDDGTPLSLDGKQQFVEAEHYKYVCSIAECYHILLNIEAYPDFLPKARELAVGFFEKANYGASTNYSPFEYSEEAFDARMMKIYDDLALGMFEPHRFDSGKISLDTIGHDADGDVQVRARTFGVGRFSDRAVKEYLRQLAPYNLVDGAFLQNILSSGPVGEVQSRLFSIWADEAGNGETELNHCNVYETLLRSLNIFLPPITSTQFIEQDFTPSAFHSAVFQLSVGLFPQEFLPELLGMTLYLEWEATPTLTPTVRMLQGRQINAQFYRLHVAIDNITSGHGALANEAIKLYLQEQEKKGGVEAVQEQWRRIWKGYVTWATIGEFGREAVERMMLIDRKQVDIRSPRFVLTDLKVPTFQETDFSDASSLLLKLKNPEDPVSEYLIASFSQEARKMIAEYTGSYEVYPQLKIALVNNLNLILEDEHFYDPQRFSAVEFSDETWDILSQDPDELDGRKLNRLLLEDAYRKEILGSSYRLIRRLRDCDKETDPLSYFILDEFSGDTRALLKDFNDTTSSPEIKEATLKALAEELTGLLPRPSIWDKERFSRLPTEAQKEAEAKHLAVQEQSEQGQLPDPIWAFVDLNRLLLEIAYPAEISKKIPLWFPDIKGFYEQRMIDLIGRKAHAARQIHQGRTLAGHALGSLFDDPSTLLQALIDSNVVDPAHPNESRFFELLDFSGPMYKVFSEKEREIVLDWIESLRESKVTAPAEGINSPAQKMKELIQKYSALGSSSHRHMTLPDPDGNPRRINDWFSDPQGFMEALVRGGWITPSDNSDGELDESMFLQLIEGDGPMANRPFTSEDVEIVKAWISAGAKSFDEADKVTALVAQPKQPDHFTFFLSNPVGDQSEDREALMSFPLRRSVIGTGSVH
jgi:hypothetical protein